MPGDGAGLEAGRGHRRREALRPQPGRSAAAREVADAAVAEADQVLRRQARAEPVVVGDDLGTRHHALPVAGHHDGQSLGHAHGPGRLGGDHQPVDAHRQEAVQRVRLHVRVERVVGDRDAQPVRRQALLQTAQQLHEPQVPPVVDDHPDGARRRPGQRRGGLAGAVAQPLHRLQDGGPPGLGDAGGAAQDEGHQGLGDARAPGDVVDGGRSSVHHSIVPDRSPEFVLTNLLTRSAEDPTLVGALQS